MDAQLLDFPQAHRPASRGTVLMLGWGGARPRQLARYIAWYEREGFEVVPFTLTPAQLCSSAAIAAELTELRARVLTGPGPILLHSFSNMGFAVYAMLLTLDTEHALRSRIVGHVLDSAPGFAADLRARDYAADLTRAVFSTFAGASWTRRPLLALLARVTLGLAMRLHFSLVRGVREGYARARARYAAHAPAVPLLCLLGEQDEVISLARVQDFLSSERRRGVALTHLAFEDSAHVCHFRDHPAAYSAALRSFVDGLLDTHERDVAVRAA